MKKFLILSASVSVLLLSACSGSAEQKIRADDAMTSSQAMEQTPSDAMIMQAPSSSSSESSEGEDVTTSVHAEGDSMIEVR